MDRKIEFDFPGREAAPTIDYYLDIDRRDGIKLRSPAAIALFDKIFETLEAFKCEISHGDEYVSLFLEAPRGSIEEFGDYEELHEYGDYDTYEEFEQSWKDYYPDPSKWYAFSSGKTDFGYRCIFMNHNLSLVCDPREEYYGKWHDGMEEYLHPYLKWLDNALKRVIEMLKEGTYNDYVDKNLDVRSRTGTILRSDLWKAYPDSKKRYFEDISKEDAEEFLRLVEEGRDLDKPAERLKQMSVGLFLKACELGYRANYDEDPSATPRELYKKHADGRDDGLLKLPDDDPEAYENWDPDSWDNFNGHHPWEVCRGGSSTHVSLYPMKDDKGYFFSLAGYSYGRSIETIKFFLAIRRAGYPVGIYRAKEMARRFLGNDKIGIVPNGIFPRYCESLFPGEEILDFMNIGYEDGDEDLVPYVEWQEIEKVELSE